MGQEDREFFQVGYRVRCVATNQFTGQWTPPKGICGTIKYVQDNSVKVRWDEGTLPGEWWCNMSMVAPSNV